MQEAWDYNKAGNHRKCSNIIKEVRESEFKFSKGTISYGNCSKLDKTVSFIANTFQLDTQECFKNRKNEEFR